MTHLYYIKVSCQYYHFKVLIDCGANVSIISSDMLGLLGLSLNKKSNIVHGIGGHAKILGTVKCKMVIKTIPIIVDFSVISTPEYMAILGLDFLEKYKCIINTQNKTVLIANHIIPCLNRKEIQLLKVPIKLHKPIKLEPANPVVKRNQIKLNPAKPIRIK